MKLTNFNLAPLAAVTCLFVAGTLPLSGQTPIPLGGAGSRPVAVLLCQYPNSANTYGFQPSDILATWMTNTATVNGATVDNSINGLVQEASQGTLNFQGSQAFGWFTLPNKTTFYQAIPSAANPAAPGMAIGNDCIATAQQKGVNLAPFTYVAVYLNDVMPGANSESWTATLPGPPSPTQWNAMILNFNGLNSPPVAVHELGHILSNMGIHTDSGSDPLGKAQWYGISPKYSQPPYDFATASPGWDASRRELMGFIPSVATYSGGTQTYNISRLTQPYPGLPAAIDVPLPNGAKYVISARTRVGHDAMNFNISSGDPANNTFNNYTLTVEGVKIELFTSTVVDAHIETSGPVNIVSGIESVFLNGQTYTDSVNGITVTVVNFNPTANPTAQVTVSTLNAVPPGSWQTQPGSLVQISAGSDGTVMGVNGQNQILQWTGQGFTQLAGAALNVAVVSSTKAFAWNGNALYVWNGTAWSQGPALPAGVTGVSWMSAASDGTLYAVDTIGNVNRLDAATGIWYIVGFNAGHIAAKSGSVFYMLQSGSGTLPAGTIQMISGGFTGTTTTLPGNLKDISVDSVGDLWGVNGNNTVYHWNGTGWDQEPGSFTQVAVSNPTTLWAITGQGAVSQWH